jgi:hypothetical membrane protein
MSGPHLDRRITSHCLLAAAVMPIIFFGTQIVAAPFYPGYSFSQQSVSMLGTHFSRHPWIFTQICRNISTFPLGFVMSKSLLSSLFKSAYLTCVFLNFCNFTFLLGAPFKLCAVLIKTLEMLSRKR